MAPCRPNVKSTPDGVLIDYQDWRTILSLFSNLLTIMETAPGYTANSGVVAPADSPKLLDRVRDRIRRKG
jgi:hypothetical protein